MAEFVHVADAAAVLAPFLIGKGFAGGSIGPIVIPPTGQVVRMGEKR